MDVQRDRIDEGHERLPEVEKPDLEITTWPSATEIAHVEQDSARRAERRRARRVNVAGCFFSGGRERSGDGADRRRTASRDGPFGRRPIVSL
jgi:hypothetical protein